jgi:hypothetical protein
LEEPALEQPDVHTPHARHGGLPRWLELVIAVTALITSISSIAIAVHHGRIMEKLVQANSLPYMQGGFSDATPDGTRVLSLDVLNRGVGPAHQQSLRVTVDGRNVRSLDELIRTSVAPEEAAEAARIFEGKTLQNRVQQRFVPGGQQQFVFRIARTPENEHYWTLLEAAQGRWDVEFCYCSVFEECWQIPGKWQEPAPVQSCPRDEEREFLP